MTAVSPDALVPPDAPFQADGSAFTWAVRDTLVIAKRNLLRYFRVPELLLFTFIQPIMFVLLFRYVFGGAIPIPGLDYVNYLMPGIFVQTAIFGSVNTGIGLAEDLHSGVIERFRALPMARSAVLAGRTLADAARNLITVTVMFVVGFLVGFRPSGGVPRIALAVVLLLLFCFALSWVFAIVGLRVANAEAAQVVSFPLIFPLTFASSAFVPVNTMPPWLQAFAEHQPVTAVVDAVRGLMLGPETSASLQQAGLFNHSTPVYVAITVAWIVLILGISAPLAVARYRRAI